MNDEYLWNGQGTSPEIEKLESLLTDFRYQPVPPPALPKPASRWWQVLRFAPIVATAAAAVLIVGWAVTSSTKTLDTPGPLGDVIAYTAPVDTRLPPTQIGPVPQKPMITRALFIQRPASRRRHGSGLKKPPVTLTAEEKNAYDQVVLALFITGTQLRTVHDTINSMESNDEKRTLDQK
ncbi:MAG TPA: hypothetical protein VGO43_02250 [Pyrinomonadaceae bacterium]|jgi:hypothetical protein|nr:hypothetical protein [Pyrinomonadaceae bacterium]